MRIRVAVRALTTALGVLALAAPAAGATDYTADPGTFGSVVATAASTPGANVLTLSGSDFGPRTVPAISASSLTIVGQAGTKIQLTTNGGNALTLRRLQLTGSQALTVAPSTAIGATVNVDNSLVLGTTTATPNAGNPVHIVFNQVTQRGGGDSLNGTAPGASFVLSNSVLGSSVNQLGNTSAVFCSFSSVPATPAPLGCMPGSTGNIANPSNLDDLFAGAPTDLHPRTTSQLVDGGADTEVNAAVESPVDLDGNPRRVSYAHCTVPPRRDIGAYELPPVVFPPSVAITGPPTGVVGQTSIYGITGADSGSVTNAVWSFSDGGAASGSSIGHTWAAAGNQTVTLTASNASGCASTVSAPVTITAPPDKTAPKITKAKLKPTHLKPMNRPKLTLTASEAVTITTTVIRRDPGVRKGGKCIKRKKGVHGPGCLRDHALTHAAISMPKGTSTVKLNLGTLKAAHYVLEIAPKDAAGNVGKKVRLSFTVSKG